MQYNAICHIKIGQQIQNAAKQRLSYVVAMSVMFCVNGEYVRRVNVKLKYANDCRQDCGECYISVELYAHGNHSPLAIQHRAAECISAIRNTLECGKKVH